MTHGEAMLMHVEDRCVNHCGRIDRRLVGRDERPMLDALMEAGYLTLSGSWSDPVCKLTEKGWAEAHRLRKQQAEK